MSQVLVEQGYLSDAGRKPVLEVKDLSVVFKKSRGVLGSSRSFLRAVDEVTFKIFEGDFVSLVGESGSGKTTIARCISLLKSPTSGAIRYNGVDVTNLKGRNLQSYRRDTQIIYQDPFESLNPRQTVFTIIATPLRVLAGVKNRDAQLQRVSRLLEEVNLNPEEVVQKFPHQLSGGQRQRVNIARALAPDPKLLIADEPVTMLDATQRFNVLSLLMKLRKSRNLTVLMITHDLASAKLVSDKIMVIYLGRIVEMGKTGEVLAKPHHPYVELIMNSMPTVHRSHAPKSHQVALATIDESKDIEQGCSFSPRCKYATEVCGREQPLLVTKTPEHFAACHNSLNMEQAGGD